MYIKHEDSAKLPRSLLINSNESQFRIFFIDKLINYICKTTAHIFNSSKKNNHTEIIQLEQEKIFKIQNNNKINQ